MAQSGPFNQDFGNNMNPITKYRFHILLFALTAVVLFGIASAYDRIDIPSVAARLNQQTNPLLFIAFMAVLPIVGFPINLFLLLSSIKLGMVYAILSWAIVLPLHVIAGYYLATRLRDYAHKLLIQRLGFQVPSIPVTGTARFSFFFFLIPGLPYAAKNYLLPMAGVPFRYCVWMNIALQGAFGIPMIVLGQSAAQKNIHLFYVALLILLIAYALLRLLKK